MDDHGSFRNLSVGFGPTYTSLRSKLRPRLLLRTPGWERDAQSSGADITISNGDGSTTVSKAFQYLPAVQQYPLPGAVLVQGIYDAGRDVYYFTDQTQVRVFSKTRAQWLASIPMPAGAQRLWGISLSRNGSKLVNDGRDNVLIAITGQTGDGIAVIDLTSLPESVPAFAAASRSQMLPMARWTSKMTATAEEIALRKSSGRRSTRISTSPQHITNSPAQRR